MHVLILNTDYSTFLADLYRRDPALARRSYAEQYRARGAMAFGVSASYARELAALGHTAQAVYVNDQAMQMAWAREHQLALGAVPELSRSAASSKQPATILRRARELLARTGLRRFRRLFRPLLRSISGLPPALAEVLAAQIAAAKPDLIINLSMVGIGPQLLRPLIPAGTRLIGQHAATALPDYEDYSFYDLIVSSFPPTVAALERRKLPAAYLRLAFDPGALEALERRPPRYPISFIGSLMNIHSSRVALLEAVCQAFPQTRVWAPDIERLAPTSPIRACHAGAAFGHEMLQILADSQLTLNHHGDIAPYANNLRLYEATGVGTLLITDARRNLAELFAPGRELVAYQNPQECVRQIGYYLDHEAERAAIARAGQLRTLTEHTYRHRIAELMAMIEGRGWIPHP